MGLIYQNKDSKQFFIVGGVLSLFGTIVIINSHKHINRAGILMDERGVGVKIKL